MVRRPPSKSKPAPGPDLSVTFCGVRFENPLVLASGIIGVTGGSLYNAVRHGAGGATTKSIWRERHVGHPNPVILGFPHYLLNAVGVPDAGIEKAHETVNTYKKFTSAPLIANIIAGKKADYAAVAEAVAKLQPDVIEVNISCPNVEDEFGRPFACDLVAAPEVTRLVKARAGKIPVVVKLSPNVENITEIAKAVEQAGADGLCVMNTLGPGMAIDIETGYPILSNKVGGISGPAIKPLAIRLVHDVSRSVKIPIIGTGGVTTGEDALEMMMAGATLVGVGSAVYYHGPEVFAQMTQIMSKWCASHDVSALRDLIGRTHTVLKAHA